MSEMDPPTMEEVRKAFQLGVTTCGCCAYIAAEDAEEFDRFIAKVRADALREWADRQDAVIERYPDMSNELGRKESKRWTSAVRAYAKGIEQEARDE